MAADGDRASRRALVREQLRGVSFAALARYIGAQSAVLEGALSRDEQLWLYGLYKCATDGPISPRDAYGVLRRLAASAGLYGASGYRACRKNTAWSTATAWLHHCLARDEDARRRIRDAQSALSAALETTSFAEEARLQYAELLLDAAPVCWPDEHTFASLRMSGGSSGPSTQSRTGMAGNGEELEMIDDLLSALEEDDDGNFLALCALHNLAPDTVLGEREGWQDEPIALVHLVAEMTALECCKTLGSLTDEASALDCTNADGLTAAQALFKLHDDTASACAQALIDAGASH